MLQVFMQCLWEKRFPKKFNVLSVGQVFRSAKALLVLGCEDGVIRLFNLPTSGEKNSEKCLQCTSALETKGGPIQQLALHNVTRFGSVDLVAADSQGTVTIFCNEQILARCSLGEHSISCLDVEEDAIGNLMIVAGDEGGTVNAFLPYSTLWRLRLQDTRITRGVNSVPTVRCLLAVGLCSSTGDVSNYILAADNYRNLHVIQGGTIVQTLPTNAIINAMCAGNFVDTDDVHWRGGQKDIAGRTVPSQVALGGEDGSIYIMSNFQVSVVEYSNVKLPLTQLLCVQDSMPGQEDFILCAGHFNALFVYQAGKRVCQHKTPDWIVSMATADVDRDGNVEVVVGCLDNTVQALKLTTSR
ncbi:uncharacterized protein [Branchiostoma lanceolatum]|uniref:Hypp2655 protein n=1 Tax=Branchiostoma lanceolatum TaxID=7740 RepID=A0A8K0EUL5_BRALA|nr:Hypp2655 [Branchiostoma lanceolatum]